MSWSAGTRAVAKGDVDAAIDAIMIQASNPEMDDQLRTAKQAAKLILATIPGPFVMVSMSGHANGIGWHGRDGWSNDSITVNVTQVVEAPK